jgi:hypothetical protein
VEALAAEGETRWRGAEAGVSKIVEQCVTLGSEITSAQGAVLKQVV